MRVENEVDFTTVKVYACYAVKIYKKIRRRGWGGGGVKRSGIRLKGYGFCVCEKNSTEGRKTAYKRTK